MSAPRGGRAPDASAHPLWGLTCILGEIALRLERERAEERTAGSPETRGGTAAPTGREEGRR